MKKRFIAKRKKIIKLKYILLLFIAFISFYYGFNLLMSIKPLISSEDLLNIGLSNTKIKYKSIGPKELLYLSTNILLDNVSNNIQVIEKSSNDDKPLVYIYNTHDTESYTSHLLEAYNISFTVKTASLILRDYLSSYGISSYIETESMAKYLRDNGLIYKDSYKASRHYFIKRMKEYPSIKLYIDLHRDSARKNATTIEIDNKKYAKILFVVGLDHDNYESNLHLAETLNSMIDKRLSRGISKKTGSKVNGIYNQDLSENSFLIEVGGQDNTIEEVNNTLKELSLIIFKYMENK